MDQRGLVTYWNPSAERLFGLGRDEALAAVRQMAENLAVAP